MSQLQTTMLRMKNKKLRSSMGCELLKTKNQCLSWLSIKILSNQTFSKALDSTFLKSLHLVVLLSTFASSRRQRLAKLSTLCRKWQQAWTIKRIATQQATLPWRYKNLRVLNLTKSALDSDSDTKKTKSLTPSAITSRHLMLAGKETLATNSGSKVKGVSITGLKS